MASLVPPPRANLTRFHGVFAPGAKVRPFLLPQAEAEPGLEEESPALVATVESTKERTPRLDPAGGYVHHAVVGAGGASRRGGRAPPPDRGREALSFGHARSRPPGATVCSGRPM
ncbi:hypothetical protein F0U61_26610 [Archangium violaceum]|nr:hypothetical protein F0U61_26610 [Archangium violaceum]